MDENVTGAPDWDAARALAWKYGLKLVVQSAEPKKVWEEFWRDPAVDISIETQLGFYALLVDLLVNSINDMLSSHPQREAIEKQIRDFAELGAMVDKAWAKPEGDAPGEDG